jgi:hypothetical protein
MVYTPIKPALGRLRQEDLKFKVSLGYMVRPCPLPVPQKRHTPYTHPEKIQTIINQNVSNWYLWVGGYLTYFILCASVYTFPFFLSPPTHKDGKL